MINIDIYDNGVIVENHANDCICRQVSVAITILVNNVGMFNERIYHHTQNGYTELIFNVTRETDKLLRSYINVMNDLSKTYHNDIKINIIENTLLPFDNKRDERLEDLE